MVGGTGSHVVQQLAYLGVGALTLVDHDEIDETSLNRHVAARAADPVPGSPKVALGERLVREVDPDIQVSAVPDSLLSEEGFRAVLEADVVFGCLDDDGLRFVLNELCCAYEKPYFDVASGITPSDGYGGRVCVVVDSRGCLYCHDELELEEVDAYLSTASQQVARLGAYGMPPEDLGSSGPSVVSINGVVASLAVTEFMVWATGIRAPFRLLTYRGNRGVVTFRPDDDALPWRECHYCTVVRGKRDDADVQRYIKVGSAGAAPSP